MSSDESTEPQFDPRGKVVVVTGAASGIGKSLAELFAAEGAAAVIVTDRDEAGATAVAEGIGSVARGVGVDVANKTAIEALVADIEANEGPIDVFISNAGYGVGGGLSLPDDEWKQMMEVHMWSHLYAARAVVPGMVERGGGYILNTASAAGLLTQMDSGPYAVSKHAAVAFGEWLLINYGDRGIGVSVLCPQAVRTNIMANRVKTGNEPKGRQAAGDGVLEPEDVARDCLDAMREGRFLVLPHPEVLTYFQRKATDYDRWLSGMRRFRRRLGGK
ncbi:MAG: NAD(P)-dependent dehydrogenase (short-subunit alcohol dehydrogenase family) [Candidatus Poriferisodalaceae bacterium]|jgi:NAD(P)-dependent dehydrogenase (short-subunit alcohol dehydrogenase family)